MMPHINELAKNKDKFWKDLEKSTISILLALLVFVISVLLLYI